MAQPVEQLTLHFSSGHDLSVVGSSPELDFVLSTESACPSPYPMLTLTKILKNTIINSISQLATFQVFDDHICLTATVCRAALHFRSKQAGLSPCFCPLLSLPERLLHHHLPLFGSLPGCPKKDICSLNALLYYSTCLFIVVTCHTVIAQFIV